MAQGSTSGALTSLNSNGIRFAGAPLRTCDEKGRLAIAFHAGVDKLNRVAGSLKAGTPAWRNATNEARQECEDAIALLNEHRAEHGC
jgi:hypothetical protein